MGSERGTNIPSRVAVAFTFVTTENVLHTFLPVVSSVNIETLSISQICQFQNKTKLSKQKASFIPNELLSF